MIGAWDNISKLIRARYTADVVIGNIYKSYRESLPVTTIITDMIEDWENGGHPQLCI
jgi:hypothetical protein